MSLQPPLLVVGLTISLALPALALWRRWTPVKPDWPQIERGLLRWWAVLGLLVGLVAFAGAPSDLGLGVVSVGTLLEEFFYGFVAFAGTMIVVALAGRATGGLAADPASLVVFEQPSSRRLAVAVSSATVESIVLFGFVVEALFGLGAGPWLAGSVAAASLLIVRARWSDVNALQWLPGAIVLAAIAVLTRSALVVLAVRLVYDGITFLSGDADDYRAPADVE